jgi:uncharacterized membrane protein
MTLPPDTIEDLDGNANTIDYSDEWNDLSAYHQAIYYFGDYNCHQKWYRSFSINDNQMPVDARMTSMFIFFSIGMGMMMFTEPNVFISEAILNIFPKKFRELVHRKIRPEMFMAILIILAALPVAIDGFYQLLTPYESTNFIRVLTGIPSGIIGGVIIGATIFSVVEADKYFSRQKQNRSD